MVFGLVVSRESSHPSHVSLSVCFFSVHRASNPTTACTFLHNHTIQELVGGLVPSLTCCYLRSCVINHTCCFKWLSFLYLPSLMPKLKTMHSIIRNEPQKVLINICTHAFQSYYSINFYFINDPLLIIICKRVFDWLLGIAGNQRPVSSWLVLHAA